ncbi:MAG: hypothetical protein HY077_09960 [Elusimicrobia bacterium]|nr:hypothetical protein [Elusimicrobiota bacterium]
MKTLGNSRGSGLVLSLIALTTLALLSGTVYRVTRSQVRESVYVLRQAQAHFIAETGMEDALWRLSKDASWREGFEKKPFGGGDYTVTLSTEDPPWINSTGYSPAIALLGPAVMTVRARAQFTWDHSVLVRAAWQPDTWATSYQRR